MTSSLRRPRLLLCVGLLCSAAMLAAYPAAFAQPPLVVTPRAAPGANPVLVPPMARQQGAGVPVPKAPSDDAADKDDAADAAPAAPVAPIGPARYKVQQGGGVSLNYVDADVREIVRLILGDILKVNYSIDPGFQGTATIQTARPLKRSELIQTLQGLLTQAGGQLTYEGNLYRISQAGDDTSIPPLVRNGSMEAGAQVMPLRYTSAKQLATILQTYAGDGVKIAAEPSRNALIISGSAGARQIIADLVRVFDVDYLAGQAYALFPAKSGDPTKLATDLEAALGGEELSGAVKIVPIDQANAIMVITRQQSTLERVSHLLDQINAVKISAGRKIHVYRLKNTQPADIQPILQRAINPSNNGAGDETAPGNLPPTSTPAHVGFSQTAGGPGSTGGPGAGSNPNGALPGSQATGAAAAPTTSTPRQEDTNQSQTGGDPKGPQIIADNVNGALIVVSTDSEYEIIEEALRKLDVLPMQVLVEATIAEVTLNKDLQYGVQFFLQNQEGQVGLSNAVSGSPTVINPASPVSNASLFPGVLAPSFPGFAVARTAGDVQLTLQALKNITDVKVVSAPKLLILDRQEATFQVGDLVPTITQSATSVITAGAPVVNNVQYQPTGVILTVTPRINAGGLVTLDIEQEVSDVVQTTSSSINSPTFQQRKIKTKVIVQDGQTISLAGLISDKTTLGNSGVPLLQDIPVLGTLFSTKTNNRDRTELLILLTPRVVHDQREAKALTEELKSKLSPSSIVP